jgi:hypothetical protein
MSEAWNKPIRHFCESYHTGGPEVLNSLSSLLISWLAWIGLFGSMNNHYNTLTKLCYSSLFICGIGSFGFHWTLTEAWSFLDTFPMTVSSCLGLYVAWLTLSSEIPYFKKSSLSHRMSKTSLFVSGLLITTLMLNAVYGNVQYDNLFTILGFLISITIMCIWRIKHPNVTILPLHKVSTAVEEVAIRMILKGLCYVTVAALFWTASEKFCMKYSWIRFLHLHSLWHMVVSYGVYLQLQGYTAISAYLWGCKAVINNPTGFLPGVTYYKLYTDYYRVDLH